MQQQLRVDKLVMDQQLFSRVESGAKKQSNYFFFSEKEEEIFVCCASDFAISLTPSNGRRKNR